MYLKVIVTPGARKERIEEKDSETLYISVREKASRNCANTRIREILAERLGVALTQVRILTGHHSRSKMISISTR